MSSLPYMKLYVSDFAGDTLGLSAAEIGGYVLILMAMWNSKDGWLTTDQMRRASRATNKRWGPTWATLRGYLVEGSDGRFSSRRLLAEMGLADPHGTKSIPLKGDTNDTLERGHVVHPKPLKTLHRDLPPSRERARDPETIDHRPEEIEAPSEPPSPVVPADDWPNGKIDDWMTHLVMLCPGRLNPQIAHNLVTSMGVIGQWKLLGYSWAYDVVPVVTSAGRSRDKSLIRAWGYFDPAVRRSFANRAHAGRPIDPSEATGDHSDDKLARKNDQFARDFAITERLARERGERG